MSVDLSDEFAIGCSTWRLLGLTLLDLRIADQWIVWEAATDVRITRVRSQKFVVLKVSHALEELLFATTFKKDDTECKRRPWRRGYRDQPLGTLEEGRRAV